ncbi:amino acid permease [Glarea lozoyensis ATCC 20868]|uniref:Amino acid permease n=1 Tax=Glarea lozoyensis (strain ATCC 20868 / MF5171) TaxID=1116229 RepID=S3CJ91_GLAL2|nr:amino acid permease [Glarea lozoyensis ATCC 20868]EPE25860.1 amino acid permease [Glarea lozoyensis ATCC 20868]
MEANIEKAKTLTEQDANIKSATLNDLEVAKAEGQTEELRKGFGTLSLGALCLALMATWEAVTSVVAAALTNGGAPCLFYNYLISFIGSVAIAASLGEIASIVPTAGGQYHWVYAVAFPRQKRVASWITGWISIGGQIVLTASAAFAAGLQFQALITLNHPETYIPERWQGMLFYWLVLGYAAAVNIWGSKILPHTNLAAGTFHVAGLAAFLIVLGVMAPKHDAHYVFLKFSNTSGWSNDGISWLVGLLSAVYPFLGYDAACHLSEEMPDPARNVPVAMVGSVVVNGILGLAWAVMLLFCLGDLESLLTSKTGFPFMQLFLEVTKSPISATMMTLAINLTAVFANSAGLTSTSRTYWAFARDNAAPFSAYFAEVNPSLQIPVRAVILVTALEMCLGLIYLGNSTAFNAILSMAVLGMYTSYLLPILYMAGHGRLSFRDDEFGPWKMGRRTGLLVNIVAIAWLLLAIVFCAFPGVNPVTEQNMNYSTVVLGGWALFGIAFFLLSGRHYYSGPVMVDS